MEGNDHKVSLLPDDFIKMVVVIREVEESLGNSNDRKLSQGELMNREVLGKSLIINQFLAKGQTFLEEMIEIKSPGKGLPPYYRAELIGKTARRDFKPGDFFYTSDLNTTLAEPRPFKFGRPWGARSLSWLQIHRSTTRLLEFHLSYRDLEDIGKFLASLMTSTS